jgi:hypothetical protein
MSGCLGRGPRARAASTSAVKAAMRSGEMARSHSTVICLTRTFWASRCSRSCRDLFTIWSSFGLPAHRRLGPHSARFRDACLASPRADRTRPSERPRNPARSRRQPRPSGHGIANPNDHGPSNPTWGNRTFGHGTVKPARNRDSAIPGLPALRLSTRSRSAAGRRTRRRSFRQPAVPWPEARLRCACCRLGLLSRPRGRLAG